MAGIKRETALKLPLGEIAGGEFFREEGEFGLNYVTTKNGFKASRVNVWGNVVRKYESGKDFRSITIDDFTGCIDVNVFKETLALFDNIEPGNIVCVIGKIRKNNDTLYIAAEGIRVLEPNEELAKRLENARTLKNMQDAGETNNTGNIAHGTVEVEKSVVGE